MSNIDLSRLDPATLYDLERQIRAAFDSDTYVSVSFDLESNLLSFSAYGNKPDWHHLALGLSDTLVGAVRKCGEELAAAQENQEASDA